MVNDGVDDANAVIKVIKVRKAVHLALFASKRIDNGEELKYDYGEHFHNLHWRLTVNI